MSPSKFPFQIPRETSGSTGNVNNSPDRKFVAQTCFTNTVFSPYGKSEQRKKKRIEKESEKPRKAGNFELGKETTTPHHKAKAAHSNIVYKYSLLLFFSFLGFKTKVSRSFHTVWFRFAMDDVRASSAWVANHSSHVVVDSAGFRRMAKKIWFSLCV